MLRANLATRPFYNDRGMRAALGVLALVTIGLTIFNAIEILRLESAGREARQLVAQNAAQAREMLDKARDIRQAINQTQLAAVQTAAREANVLIDRRAFSWTALLNQFQLTLPPDVRITSVSPTVERDGVMNVRIAALARRVEDLTEFIDALETTGHFTGVLATTQAVGEDGTWSADLVGYYGVPAAGAAPPSPGASASAKATADKPAGQAVAPQPSSEGGTATPANVSAAAPAAGVVR